MRHDECPRSPGMLGVSEPGKEPGGKRVEGAVKFLEDLERWLISMTQEALERAAGVPGLWRGHAHALREATHKGVGVRDAVHRELGNRLIAGARS